LEGTLDLVEPVLVVPEAMYSTDLDRDGAGIACE